jgi:alpha-glucosidase
LPIVDNRQSTDYYAGRERVSRRHESEIMGTTLQPAATATGRRIPWWQTAVVYENHLPSLRDGNGDGIGDLPGLVASLDYLSVVLGVDAVWVGPFYRSPLLDHGYDISDYCDVEPVYGTLADFDTLLDEAHQRGLKIIIDYVPNHTSDQHPWFVESRSSRDSPRRDWYVWRNPAPGGGVPNNWTSEAGGSVWEYDAATAQYYLHSHLVEQPDLNWRNPEVSAALLDVLRFWLERGADGVRIDVAHMLMKDPEFRDNPMRPAPRVNRYDLQHADFAVQEHVHDRRHPDVFAILAEIRHVIDEFDDRVSIAEIEGMSWDEWAAYFGRDLDGVHLPFAFRLLETPWEAAALGREIDDLVAATPPGAWPALALGNHDRQRLATRLGARQARVAAMLLLTLRGTPTVLYGDELGLEDQPVPAARQRDHFARSDGGVSRDPVRTPMPWSATARNGGFSDAVEADLWLPVSVQLPDVAVSVQLRAPGSMLELYRRLIAARRASPALQRGSYRRIDPDRLPPDVLAYERTSVADAKIIALNLGDDHRVADIGAGGIVVLSTDPARAGRGVAGRVALDPDEAVIIDVPAAAEAGW